MRGVYYNWNEDPNNNKRIGFIAQEVNKITPELTFINENSNEKYMGVHYDNVTALLVEAIKEISGGIITSNNSHLETQTILAEDNNIELNFNGNNESAIGGGITVLNAIKDGESAKLITDSDGNWMTNNGFKPKSLIIPKFTPTSSSDYNGEYGTITIDDNFLYVKTNVWKRINMQEF